MTHEVKTVGPQHKIDQCMNIMTDGRLRHLPVVEDGRLVGLLSIGDLVKAAIAEQARLIQKMEEYIRGDSY
jgi:CBS domain-containing protein